MNTKEVGAKTTGGGSDDSTRPIAVGFCPVGHRQAILGKTWRNDVLEDDSTDLVSETLAPKRSLIHAAISENKRLTQGPGHK